jgi:FkbH-like protein
MDWLPVAADFRRDLRAALAEEDPPTRIQKLGSLARHRLSYLETIQLDRALGSVAANPPAGFAAVRLALLASSTVDHLVPAIRVSGLRRQLLVDVHLGAYGQYRQALLDPASSLYQRKPDVVLFSLTAREAIAAASLSASRAEADVVIDRAVDDLRVLWERARASLGATVLQQTFLNAAEPVFGSYDRLVAGAPTRLVARLNDRVAEAAGGEGVLLVDVARASERDGLHAWFDAARWLQGKLEIAPQAAATYGEIVARVIAAVRGLSKKCLVLDLDNTLWGGVIGDDGVSGIVLGEGSGAGEAHLALQRYAKQLGDRGVILAVCSKNDQTIAEAAFRDHPEMLLKRSDIAAFVANWDDKSVNLQRIAEQLNIGLDSLVFVDDNPVERARIRESLPMVSVPELPDDVAQYVRRLADAGYFEAVTFTDEDRARREQYAGNASRDALQASSQSLDEFLRGLDMVMTCGPVTAVDQARVTQLIGRTNQFNLTTRRHAAQDVARFCENGHAVTLQFRLVDRFGDNGLVSAMILAPDPRDGDVLEIDTWIMSCRVFGRQLEHEAMNVAVEAARARGVRAIWGDYLPTAKNGVVADLYPRLGFVQAPEAPAAPGGTRWVLELDRYVPHPTYIRRSDA